MSRFRNEGTTLCLEWSNHARERYTQRISAKDPPSGNVATTSQPWRAKGGRHYAQILDDNVQSRRLIVIGELRGSEMLVVSVIPTALDKGPIKDLFPT